MKLNEQQQQKKRLEFIEKRKSSASRATVTSTDGQLTVRHTPTAGRKKNQRRRPRAERAGKQLFRPT